MKTIELLSILGIHKMDLMIPEIIKLKHSSMVYRFHLIHRLDDANNVRQPLILYADVAGHLEHLYLVHVVL